MIEKTLDDARAAARERWGYASPYRVGYFVGLMGISCPNPYAGRVRGESLYQHGLMEGHSRRERDAEKGECNA